jgi:ubiquinone/menaquinone biosynthesis C-methylase UbiE
MTSEDDSSLKAYSSPDVVKHYAQLSGLQPAERYAFEKFVPQNASILDLGVGGGRTTPYLAAKASRYVGVDYVNAMVDACATKFPDNLFYCVNATNLSMFEDISFKVAVFSFNGIDSIPTREGRLQCFSEVFRVLMPGGLFIFSSHNSKMLFNLPRFDNAGPVRNALRFARSIIESIPFAFRLLSSGAFRVGAGYYLDPTHGGIKVYCSTPALVELDGDAAGFQLVEVIHNRHPKKAWRYFIPSYYYVLTKSPRG